MSHYVLRSYHEEHLATSWLEGTTLVCFRGLFGITAISEEILIGSHSSSLVVFLGPSLLVSTTTKGSSFPTVISILSMYLRGPKVALSQPYVFSRYVDPNFHSLFVFAGTKGSSFPTIVFIMSSYLRVPKVLCSHTDSKTTN